MDEKDFMELLITERMGMHCEKFKEDYPPTPEQLEAAEKANIAHDKVFSIPNIANYWNFVRMRALRVLREKMSIITGRELKMG